MSSHLTFPNRAKRRQTAAFLFYWLGLAGWCAYNVRSIMERGLMTMAKNVKKSSGSTSGGAAENSPMAGMPMFYHKPVAVTSQAFSGKSLKQLANFSFTAKANAMPLNAVEFILAMRAYPIVFAGQGGNAMPVAITGLEREKNLFIAQDGSWLEGAYIPAYVRRYPFIFFEAEGDKLILCLDESANMVEDGSKRPMFDEKGQPTAIVQNALAFCKSYQEQYEVTRQFMADLVQHGLLEDYQANVELMSREKISLGGFQVINENKFNALPDSVIAEWRKKGWLPLVYAHLMSFGAWPQLVSLASKKS